MLSSPVNPSCARILACALLICSVLHTVRAQDPPMEWGKINPCDIGQTSFPSDTGATAVILCDYGESHIDDDLNIVYNRHTRIRILSPAGYEWGTHSVVIDEAKDVETIDDIEGVTYTLGPDSTIVRHSMDKDAIFKEKIGNDRVRYRFTLPAIVSGCVIEYRYKVVAESWMMIRDWTFQTSEPILWSEYRVRYPQQIGYVVVNIGYEPFIVKESRVEPTAIFPSSRMAGYLNSPMAQMVVQRWAVANAPAIRKEPFITTTNDYKNRVDIQLSGYADPPHGIHRVLQDWGAVAQELAESKFYGESIDVTSEVRSRAATLTAGLTDPLEKARAIYNWVDSAIVYADGAWERPNVDEILEKRKGRENEVIALFLSMLKSVGIDGQFVLASSRSHGEIQDIYPIVSQFDEVLARVSVNGKPWFLSPMNPLRPMELLPVDLLGVKGLVVQRGGVEWVHLNSNRQSITRTMATVQIHKDGSVDGWLDGQANDYAALNIRQFAEGKNDHDIAMKFFSLDETEATLDSITIEGRNDNAKPLRLRAHVSSLSGITKAGDKIYVMPMLINREKENPLTREKRKFPVDFAYPWQQTVVATLHLPPGHVVVDSLPDRTITAESGDLLFKRRILNDSGTVMLSTQFDSHKAKYEPRAYKDLRDFYGKVVMAEGEQIVVQERKAPPPSPTSVRPPAKPRKH